MPPLYQFSKRIGTGKLWGFVARPRGEDDEILISFLRNKNAEFSFIIDTLPTAFTPIFIGGIFETLSQVLRQGSLLRSSKSVYYRFPSFGMVLDFEPLFRRLSTRGIWSSRTTEPQLGQIPSRMCAPQHGQVVPLCILTLLWNKIFLTRSRFSLARNRAQNSNFLKLSARPPEQPFKVQLWF